LTPSAKHNLTSVDAAVGVFCPIAAYVVVALISIWWIVPFRRKEIPQEPPALKVGQTPASKPQEESGEEPNAQ